MTVKPTDYQQKILVELHGCWSRLHDIVNTLGDGDFRGELMLALEGCLQWRKMSDFPAIKAALASVDVIITKYPFMSELYSGVEQIRCLVNEFNFTFTLIGEEAEA